MPSLSKAQPLIRIPYRHTFATRVVDITREPDTQLRVSAVIIDMVDVR